MRRPKNTFFQFKQFRIEQAQNAMKVSTEACILGAFTFAENPQKALDIGTGTGLLALMLAQRFPQCHIDAVEIEKNAFKEACQNIQNSPFSKQIKVFHTSIQYFAQTCSTQKYDLIICNPPFYENHLLSPNEQLNQALHQKSLYLHELAEILAQLLQKQGKAWVLLPPFSMNNFVLLAEKQQLFPQNCLQIFHSPKHPLLRKIVAFGFERKEYEIQNLFIYDEQNTYTPTFRNLLKDFYLHF
ncbi:MAG: methyltransferase [Raineya sp.]|nr:methyltransferase [Raineya sp.]MDW8295451.1 methyltransferase [Raineya sp.]